MALSKYCYDGVLNGSIQEITMVDIVMEGWADPEKNYEFVSWTEPERRAALRKKYSKGIPDELLKSMPKVDTTALKRKDEEETAALKALLGDAADDGDEVETDEDIRRKEIEERRKAEEAKKAKADEAKKAKQAEEAKKKQVEEAKKPQIPLLPNVAADAATKAYLSDANNYKSCFKKTAYTISVCKPPMGTILLNKFEQPEVKALPCFAKQDFLTPAQLNKLRETNAAMYNKVMEAGNKGLLYITNAKTPYVLCGTCGELWTISGDKLGQRYVFASIPKRLANTPTGMKYAQAKKALPCVPQALAALETKGVLDWVSVKPNPDAGIAWACPVKQQDCGKVKTPWGAVLSFNAKGVAHGLGDFVLAANKKNEKGEDVPNLADIYVVNGLIFANTYNLNKGTDWSKFVDKEAADKLAQDVTTNLPNVCGIRRVKK